AAHCMGNYNNGDFGGYNYTPPPNNQYLPPSTPASVYGPPATVYGPPAPVYGPPQPAYYKPLKDMFKEEPSSDEDGMESKQVETEQ
ncbi:hypothetical protein DOY81_015495, partial [Sarcophaga bullata]